MTPYADFLKSKIRLAPANGIPCEAAALNPALKGHQAAAVRWMIEGGCRALFASFGMGKSVIQLEAVRVTRSQAGGRGLIVIPLGVKQEFERDAREVLCWATVPKFIRRIEDADDPEGIYLTNYETIRDGKMDPAEFTVVSLDEASCLRGFGGSKTFREFMRLFTGDGGPSGRHRQDGKTVKYRFVATATPSPNDYIELLAYADFLGIMDVSQAKTRFFKRDSEKADKLTLHKHKEMEFWLWCASWALFVQRPSDLGYSDDGYVMPPLNVRWHEIPTDHSTAGVEKSGQMHLIKDTSLGLTGAAAEKRESLAARVAKVGELRRERPFDHVLIWHTTDAELTAIQREIPGAVSVWGKQDLDAREKTIIGFSNGDFPVLSTKPKIAGSGCNFQRHCHWAIFAGIDFKFNDFIQAVHRIQRFGQAHGVIIDIIYTEAERSVRATLERKWTQHNQMVANMTNIIKEFGLSEAAMAQHLTRALGVERVEIAGERYRLVNNDCVLEAQRTPDNSVDLIVTSIPFSTQYEYSPNIADFGFSEGNADFFGQMDYLTPELLRALKPGRIACIHVKDRIVPGGLNGMGFQTVYPFHLWTTQHFIKHGWAYMGMKTIVTDVVRENNQTYRLGWSEQCKDGTKMGVGMPEYLLIFRKPPTSSEKSYADEPVRKSKAEYTRARWQADAHGFARSSGDRLLVPEELETLTHAQIFQLFKGDSLERIYNYEHHVRIAQAVDLVGKLPSDFMLLQPQSWSDEVWTDITRMRTLNGAQSAAGREQHLCPLQFDIVERAIRQYSQHGELILDPFGGLGTVPYCAIKMDRRGAAWELNTRYFLDAAVYCKAAEDEFMTPTLFDLAGLESEVAA